MRYRTGVRSPHPGALWSMMLVPGLCNGRQVIVVRVHHSVTDELGALNALAACTTDTPGTVVAPQPADRWSTYGPRLVSLLRRTLADRLLERMADESDVLKDAVSLGPWSRPERSRRDTSA
jgi:wax ester synthase-like acyl-CoA acyltransferase family protein